ncbi:MULTISPECIES: ABC transporter substrate-binding protein [unclassified Shinella]|jgi:polar amino acid transport system substrate-binding protein|uniref:ABC transporter substrate-binding protein n=1 Tax=unclassified Shinella TaxID=2643062 RepID=UPI00102D4759|nr:MULTISPECIES: ABC transporter substrate-binding protein [unclassified Shinella]MCO5151109.1 ABC transporter substrate-binding protein [Shinella sp.]MDC7265958.1 ABC transporter substrate-binding protein [Shinella sp. HY16]MDC7272855.1 ABC transporter substrate-binding protein [Shinella sp. YZ44]TAA63885.1 transporter substrate-binding domain-containing protein [Shinella sp. JR1-6]
MLKSILSYAVAAGLAFSVLGAPLAARADDLETIKAAGEFKFANSGAYPPFSFVDDSNQTVGFDVDIGNEIAKRLGVKGAGVSTAWDGIIAGLLAGKYDTIIGSMTITPEREKAVDFVGPYYKSGRGVFVSDGSEIKSIDDLKDKTIGVTLGETHEKWARERGGWEIRTYKGLPELFLELKAGRIQAMIVDAVPVSIAVKQTGDKVVKLDVPEFAGTEDRIGIAIRKGNPELKAAMQKALDDMMADGTYEAIAMKWIGSDIR